MKKLITDYTFSGNELQSIAMDLPYTQVPEMATIKVSAIPGATTGNPRVDASFAVLLIANN